MPLPFFLAVSLRRPVRAGGAGFLAAADPATESTPPAKARRVLYNLDGDSCLWTKKDGKQPVMVTAADLPTLIDEIAYTGQPGRHAAGLHQRPGDVLSDQGRGPRAAISLAGRAGQVAGLGANAFSKRGGDVGRRDQDPFALLLAEARRHGLEALLTYRMNDIHGDECLVLQAVAWSIRSIGCRVVGRARNALPGREPERALTSATRRCAITRFG